MGFRRQHHRPRRRRRPCPRHAWRLGACRAGAGALRHPAWRSRL